MQLLKGGGGNSTNGTEKAGCMGRTAGAAVTSNVVLPQVLKGNNIELEGEKLEITGLEDFPTRTFCIHSVCKSSCWWYQRIRKLLQPLDGRCTKHRKPVPTGLRCWIRLLL